MSKALTPHQKDVMLAIHDRTSRAREAGARLLVVARQPPLRVRLDVIRMCTTRPVWYYRSGSPGALARLAEKGRLRIVVDDHTCPVYEEA